VRRCEGIPPPDDERRGGADRHARRSEESSHRVTAMRGQWPVRAIVFPVKFSVVTECPLDSVCT
jgi:hypothetical protein